MPWYIRVLMRVPNDQLRIWGYYLLRAWPMRVGIMMHRLKYDLLYPFSEEV